ncbi:MAG: xynC3 [Firmicutes bacterium]|nr:xynC3 [Bacillota bacterium]
MGTDVNINLTSTQQVIRGFGAASVWCGALSDAKMNTLFTDMGLSLLRVRIAPNENWSSNLTKRSFLSNRKHVDYYEIS